VRIEAGQARAARLADATMAALAVLVIRLTTSAQRYLFLVGGERPG
jgi:hypothetical protein